MDRYWLLTSTTYGTWLAGDDRGFVSNVADGSGKGVRHNLPGTEYDAANPGLQRYMANRLKGPPVYLVQRQAVVLVEQFRETAQHRSWELAGAAVMANHFHLVVGVEGDPDPHRLLGDFKAYGSRALNRHWGKPASGRWWTESGSTRKLPDESALRTAVRYLKEQPYPLVIWIANGY